MSASSSSSSEPQSSRDTFDPDDAPGYPPAPAILAKAYWQEHRAFRLLSLEQTDTSQGAEFRVVEWYEHDLAWHEEVAIRYGGGDLGAAARAFDDRFAALNAPLHVAHAAAPPELDEDDLLTPYEEERTLVRSDRAPLDELLAREAAREAVIGHADPRIAEVAGQLAALREFERIDPPYQEAMGQIDRATTILGACGETRDAADLAWTEVEQTLKARFSNPETLLERVRGMDWPEVHQLAGTLRSNPLAISAKHPRTGGAPRIPGINAAGEAERLEPRLKTVRTKGLSGLMGKTDRGATERQARVAAVALETWAEARQRGDQTRAWAAGQLGLGADTPLAKVTDVAGTRLAELKETHQELILSWRQLTPAPTLAQIERRLKGMDPETAALARSAFPELAATPRPAAVPRRPDTALAKPALAR